MNIVSKILLSPFVLLYGSAVWIRNSLYKSNFIGSTDFEIPVISVGNLSVGGTGKTPLTAYLVELLQQHYKIAVLSRGYKRKTSGYLSVSATHTAEEVGDEPLMLKLKYPNAQVSVGEQRVIAIPTLLYQQPDTQVICLDDAFQHQSVRPDINILLTPYDNPFWEDSILPLGTLREFKSGKQRANIIIVSKCPEGLNADERNNILKQLMPSENQKVFFTTVNYGLPYNIMNPDQQLNFSDNENQLLITGIANANPLKKYLREQSNEIIHFEFSDHHYFEQTELESIVQNYPEYKNWISTEKDSVRLALHIDWLRANGISIYAIPIKTFFLNNSKDEFDKLIKGFLDYFYHSESIT